MDEQILPQPQPEEDTPWFFIHGGAANLLAIQTNCTLCHKPNVRDTRKMLVCSHCLTEMHRRCYRLRVATPAEARALKARTLPKPIIVCRACRS